MRRTFLALLIAVTGCGTDAGQTSMEEPVENVGVTASELTSCARTELQNAVVTCGVCTVRLMENNFVCSEGVVGQASTEILSGVGSTRTTVATDLFGQHFEAASGLSVGTPVTIAAQWGHAFASAHGVWCQNAEGLWRVGILEMNPWEKGIVVVRSGGSFCH
jgi:hypothetical protein